MKRLLLFLCLLPSAHAEKPATMQTRVFRTPHGFMRPEKNAPASQQRVTPFLELPDPFSAEPVQVKSNIRDTARSFLEQKGVLFPKGSACFHDAPTHQLTVRNTPDMLDLISVYLDDLARQQPYSVSFHIQVLEAPGAVLRDLERQVVENADCGHTLASLLARAEKPGSGLRLVTTARIEAFGGRPAVYESIIDHAFCEALQFDMKNRVSVPYARRAVGALIELEPNVGPDHRTIELNYQIGLHPGLPAARSMTVTDPTSQEKTAFSTSDFVLAHFASNTTFTDGMTKLVAITKPPGVGTAGKQDVLWGIFIGARLQTAAIESKTSPQAHTLAEGLHSVRRKVRRSDLESAVHFRYLGAPALSAEEQTSAVPDYLTRYGIPHVKGSSFKIEDRTVLITNTLENIERIDAMLSEDFANGPKTSRYLLQIVEAPAGLLRELSADAHQHFDHGAEWSGILRAVADGSARHLDTAWIEGNALDSVTLTTGRDHAHIDGLNITPGGQSDLIIQRRLVGTSLTLTAADHSRYPRTYDYRLETHTAPESIRRLDFRDPASQKKFDLPFTDFHLARLHGRTVLHGGSVKLLSTWLPAGRPDLEKKGLQHAAFLRCVETTHLGARKADSKKLPASKDPKAWETRRFKVPPDFLSTAAAGGPPEPADPFAAPAANDSQNVPRIPVRNDMAYHVLAGAGISFPEGASASFDPITSTLTVKNTVENLLLIESYTEELKKQGPKTVVLTAHLLEGPEELLRDSIERCLTQNDHRDEMQRLLDLIPAGKAASIGTLRLESKGGSRATARKTTEHTHISEVGVNTEGVPRLTTPKRDVGLVLDAESTIGPDGITAELHINLQHDTSPPSEHREHFIDRGTGKHIEVPLTDFHTTHLQAGLTMLSGSARLIALWPGKEGYLQALFITCDIVSAQ